MKNYKKIKNYKKRMVRDINFRIKKFRSIYNQNPKEKEFLIAFLLANYTHYLRRPRYRFQSIRFLERNQFQLTYLIRRMPYYQLKKNLQCRYDTPILKRLEIVNKLKIKKLYWNNFNTRKKRKLTFSLKTLKKSFELKGKFFFNAWSKYKNICFNNDHLHLRIRAKNFKNLEKERKDFNRKHIPGPTNPVYQSHFWTPWYKRNKIFSLKKSLYQREPWLSPVMASRKLYRLTRKRNYFREKKPLKTRRLWVYNRFFKLMYPSWYPIVKGRNYHRINQLLKKYILLPYMGHLTPQQLKTLVKKLRKSQIPFNFQTSVENRLDILAYRLNFAPNIFWSRVFISLGLIWVSNCSNSTKLSRIPLPEHIRQWKAIGYNRNLKFIANSKKSHLKLLINLKNRTHLNKKFNHKNFIKKEQQYNPNYIVKQNEIVHISFFLFKKLSYFFMNRLRKKKVPLYIKLNSTKTAALLTHQYFAGSVLNQDRLIPRYWNPTYLSQRR